MVDEFFLDLNVDQGSVNGHVAKSQTAENFIWWQRYQVCDLSNSQNRAYVILRWLDWNNYLALRIKPQQLEVFLQKDGMGTIVSSYPITHESG